MKKTILEVYALAVCFVAAITIIVSSGIALYNTLKIVKPDFTVSSWEFEKIQDNDSFWNEVYSNKVQYEADKKTKIRPPEEELTKARKTYEANFLKAEQRDGAQSLVNCLITIFVSAAAFGLHWIIARRSRIQP